MGKTEYRFSLFGIGNKYNNRFKEHIRMNSAKWAPHNVSVLYSIQAKTTLKQVLEIFGYQIINYALKISRGNKKVIRTGPKYNKAIVIIQGIDVIRALHYLGLKKLQLTLDMQTKSINERKTALTAMESSCIEKKQILESLHPHINSMCLISSFNFWSCSMCYKPYDKSVIRYRCGRCINYDECLACNCYSTHRHTMDRVAFTLKKKWFCNDCHAYDKTYRYRCHICIDYDLCQNCYQKQKENKRTISGCDDSFDEIQKARAKIHLLWKHQNNKNYKKIIHLNPLFCSKPGKNEQNQVKYGRKNFKKLLKMVTQYAYTE